MDIEHELKIRTEFYLRQATEQKSFEVRKNDRDFQVGDILLLREWEKGKGYIENSEILRRRIVYMTSFGCLPGYVVLGVKSVKSLNLEDYL